MVFSNLVFIFLFLPITLLVYFIVKNKWKNYILLLASLFFYAWGEPKYVILMIISIIMNYILGLLIDKYQYNVNFKKTFLILAVIINLLILGVFKYLNFFIDNINHFFNLSIQMDPIPLPIGISFFTFQAMSYIIDVYRKDTKVQKNFFSLSLYISLFPQLVAGPIVRYNTISEQINKRIINNEKFSEGVQRFIIGLSKKVLLANSFAEIADSIFDVSVSEVSMATAWIGILAYSLQIYFDFSGYSDMAIGLGKMFGFDFLENFNYPYISQSVSEFWRRWHISLSTWFRDYVYISLGGNRKGHTRTLINLIIVWTITGFWHGADWTFMAWGFYFGVLIIIERIGLERVIMKMYRPLRHIYLLVIVMIGWVFFRANDFVYSIGYIKTMFGFNYVAFIDNEAIIYLHDYWMVFLFGIIFSFPIIKYLNERIKRSKRYEKQWRLLLSLVIPNALIGLLVLCTLFLVNSTYNPFIYFRF